MAQQLHIVFGGELVTPDENVFKNPDDIHVVGVFADRDAAYDAWKTNAQQTVDNAHMRYFLGDLQQLLTASSPEQDAQE